jgi:hypothetical protein
MSQGMNPDETMVGAHSGKEPQIDRKVQRLAASICFAVWAVLRMD